MFKKYFITLITFLATTMAIQTYCLQEGTLTLTNLSEVPAALRLETIPDNGTIGQVQWANTGRKIIMPEADPNKWVPFAANQRLEINTPISVAPHLGGTAGKSLWGSVVQLYILNRQNNRANLFLLSKVAEYMVARNAQGRFVLIDNDGGIIDAQ